MLTSPSQVKSEGNLPETLDDALLEPHIAKAEIEVKKIITSAEYEKIKALEHDDDDFIACSMAEANLALAYAIPVLNIETQGTGIVRSKGWDQSRSDLLSQNEVDRLIERFRSVAMDLLQPYLPQVEVAADGTAADEVRGANYRMVAL